MPDANTVARIEAARSFLADLGPANPDDALNEGSPAVVFRSLDGKRRISAERISTWYPPGTVEILYLDGYTSADEPVRQALIEFMWLSTGSGIRELNFINGQLAIPSAAGWVTAG